jgi:hypothetical protein
MTTDNFTKANLESTVGQIATDFLLLRDRAEKLRDRCAAELASGTLDLPAFYQGDPNGKSNILGTLDDLHAVYQAVQNTTPLPAKDYRLYLNHFIGI